MRRHGPIPVLLSLLLAAWLPWCLCDRAGMGCCDPVEAEPVAETSCSGSCCASHAAPDEDPTPPDDGCRPFGECAAGCCAAKGPVTAAIPEIPVDSIGSPIPRTLVADPGEFRLVEPLAKAADEPGTAVPKPGPGVRADSARRLLAAICIQTT